MIWIAIEDTATCEVSEFEQVTNEDVRYLMDGYKVDQRDVTRFCVHDVEGDHTVVYKGVTYKGGFGYNLWVASKYIKV